MADHPEQISETSHDQGGRANSLEQELSILRAILRKTDAAHRRPALLEGFLWYLVTLGAVALSALLLGALVSAAIPVVTGWMLVIGAAAATIGALAALVGFQIGKGDVESVAVKLQRHNPSLRNDLVAALEFGERLRDEDAAHDFSPQMARLHIKRTVRELVRRCEHGHVAHLLPTRDLVAPSMSLAGCLALLIVPLLVDADWTTRVLASPFASPPGEAAEETERRPVVGNLSLYFSPPSYTGLERKADPWSTGYIETLVGSEVTIEAQPLIEQARQVEMVIETAEGTNAIVMEPIGQGMNPKVRASFVALEPGSYHFRATRADGSVVEDSTERDIKLVPDEQPKVALTSHGEEVEVSPGDVLEIDFEVSDDFGLDSVTQSYYFAGDEENATRKQIDLPELANSPTETSGTVEFDLGPLALQPKDVVVFHIEATDNNTLTGPGVGQSKTLRLRVSSPEDKHLQNIADQQKLMEELLVLLADYLETPMGERELQRDETWRQIVAADADIDELAGQFRKLERLQSKQKDIIASMKELVGRLEEDPLMLQRDLTLFSALQEQLADLHKDGQRVFDRVSPTVDGDMFTIGRAQQVATYASRAEGALEKGVLRFEDLLASQKMEAIKATAEDIKELKERLKELLKKYKETKDPELKKAILREIQRLRQRMAELMQRMQMQLQKLPQEHMNLDAIKQQQMESDTRKMADSLSKIEEMLKNDDVDGALKALEDMEMNLDSLTEDMNEQFSQAQPQGLSELDKKVGELMDEVNDLQQAEKALEEETSKLNQELAEKRREQIEQMLGEFTEKMLEQVEQQEQALDKMEEAGMRDVHRDAVENNRERLESLQKMLEDKDIEQSLEKARESMRELRRMGFHIDLSRRYANSPEQKKDLEGLKRRNERMEERGQKMVDDLEQMMDQAQQKLGQMDQQKMQQLAERQQKIAERAQKLQQKIGEAGKRFPMLQKQLQPSMEGSKQSMEEAQKSLEKRRTQRALDAERSALEQLGQLKQQMQKAVQKQRQQQRDGGRGMKREKVEIPGQGGEKSGEKLRKDVMDKMKEDKLENYESEIERYYKSIME